VHGFMRIACNATRQIPTTLFASVLAHAPPGPSSTDSRRQATVPRWEQYEFVSNAARARDDPELPPFRHRIPLSRWWGQSPAVPAEGDSDPLGQRRNCYMGGDGCPSLQGRRGDNPNQRLSTLPRNLSPHLAHLIDVSHPGTRGSHGLPVVISG
jgi:hypothetical protein